MSIYRIVVISQWTKGYDLFVEYYSMNKKGIQQIALVSADPHVWPLLFVTAVLDDVPITSKKYLSCLHGRLNSNIDW